MLVADKYVSIASDIWMSMIDHILKLDVSDAYSHASYVQSIVFFI